MFRDVRRQYGDGALADQLRRVYPGLPVYHAEKIGCAVSIFCGAQKQTSVRFERVVKHGTELRLQLPVKIDQQITTANQINAYERGVFEHTVNSKKDEVSHLFAYTIMLAVFDEEAAQPLFRDVLLDSFGIAALAGHRESPL